MEHSERFLKALPQLIYRNTLLRQPTLSNKVKAIVWQLPEKQRPQYVDGLWHPPRVRYFHFLMCLMSTVFDILMCLMSTFNILMSFFYVFYMDCKCFSVVGLI